MKEQNKKLEFFILVLIAAYYVTKLVCLIWYAPFPWEIREGVGLKMGEYFASTINPYIFNDNIIYPYANYMYGFAVPVIFALLNILFKGQYVLACEIVTCLIEVLGIFCAYKLLRLGHISRYLSSVTLIGIIACYWRYNAIGGTFPDTYGLTLTLFICYLLKKHELSKKYHPFGYALLMILLFFVKQYFVVLALGLLIYLMVKDKRCAVKYSLCGAIIGSVSIILVRVFMPTYFTHTILLLNTCTQFDLARAIKQFVLLAQYFGWVYVAFFVLLFVLLGKERIALAEILSYEFIQTIVMGLAMFYFGQSDGTFYTYYLQLWIPYLLITTCELASAYTKISNIEKIIRWPLIVKIGVLVASIAFLSKFLYIHLPSAKEKSSWNEVYNILNSYDKDEIFIRNNALALYCVENGVYNESWGHDGVFSYNTLNVLQDMNYSKMLFPYAEEMTRQYLDYHDNSEEKIINGEYECLVVNAGEMEHMKTLLSKYRKIYHAILWCGERNTEIFIYERIN